MSEKRKPSFTILLKKQGKTKSNKMELFDKRLFKDYNYMDGVWRLRVNGKWFPKDKVHFYTSNEVRNMFWRHITGRTNVS